jgi:hypothetical protein
MKFSFLPLTMRAITGALLVMLLPTAVFSGQAQATEKARQNEAAEKQSKPLFRDFMGLNVHTVQFKPELYKPVCRLVRDYHGFDWDVGGDTNYAPRFPSPAIR